MFMFANLLIANAGTTHNSQLIDTCNYKPTDGNIIIEQVQLNVVIAKIFFTGPAINE